MVVLASYQRDESKAWSRDSDGRWVAPATCTSTAMGFPWTTCKRFSPRCSTNLMFQEFDCAHAAIPAPTSPLRPCALAGKGRAARTLRWPRVHLAPRPRRLAPSSDFTRGCGGFTPGSWRLLAPGTFNGCSLGRVSAGLVDAFFLDLNEDSTNQLFLFASLCIMPQVFMAPTP